MTLTPEATIRVSLADDHPIFLQILNVFFANDHEIRIVGKATYAEGLTKQNNPDVVATDAKVPILSGIGPTRIIKPPVRNLTKVLFLLTLILQGPL
jgi:DNA-binding NarL/FixJ family response regulator